MITVAFVVLALAAGCFLVRLFLGPTVADRMVALDALLVTIMCGVMVGAADNRSQIGIDTLLVVAMLSFVAPGAIARYVEQRGRPD
jgi:multisubunit Na+/H+ antiporter MnhF subunit